MQCKIFEKILPKIPIVPGLIIGILRYAICLLINCIYFMSVCVFFYLFQGRGANYKEMEQEDKYW